MCLMFPRGGVKTMVNPVRAETKQYWSLDWNGGENHNCTTNLHQTAHCSIIKEQLPITIIATANELKSLTAQT